MHVSHTVLAAGRLETRLSKASCTDARNCRCFPTVAWIRHQRCLDGFARAGFHLSFEDPADFLEDITPARLRLLREISTEPVALSALALILARDPSAVRRDVALLESQSLVTTSKVSNSGHGKRTVVRRVATRIELAAVV